MAAQLNRLHLVRSISSLRSGFHLPHVSHVACYRARRNTAASGPSVSRRNTSRNESDSMKGETFSQRESLRHFDEYDMSHHEDLHKGGGGFRRRSPSNFSNSDSDVPAMAEIEELENMFLSHSEDLKHDKKLTIEEGKKKLLFHIMQKKYNRTPKETKLLTWVAMEQIRFLHAEDPDTWTHHALAESFPVSVQGVRKLLKSKNVPRSWEEVVKHDKRVQENWKALQAGRIQEENMPLIAPERWLLAAGNKALPMPNLSDRFQPPRWRQKHRPIGKFESILDKYQAQLESQTSMAVSDGNSQQLLEDLHGENDKLLTNLFQQTTKSEDSDRKLVPERIASQTEQYLSETAVSNFSRPDELLTGPEDSEKDYAVNLASRQNKKKPAVQYPSAFASDPQRSGSSLRQADPSIYTHAETARKRHVLERLHYEVPSVGVASTGDALTRNAATREAYMFDSVRGYQYPLGKVDRTMDEKSLLGTKLGAAPVDKGGTIKKGDTYYDEDGELLYRVPGS